ncbi:hypothetical protein [Fontivita pretiosa]|uniref:hypothetical protein n=1 Tax=Fontivita pretiosa TaxID=2989684 RepID=UPI003D16EB7F
MPALRAAIFGALLSPVLAVMLCIPARAAVDENQKIKWLDQTLGALEATIQLYRSQHDGADPDFARLGWRQLISPTDPTGRIVKSGTCGPYLNAPPGNPLNGFSGVAVIDQPPHAGMHIAGERMGFAFYAATGSFVGTDATGKRLLDPDLKRAYPGAFAFKPAGNAADLAARRKNLLAIVQSLRQALAAYRIDHLDQLPDFRRYPDWQQLTARTDNDGTLNPRGRFGPYLRDIPINPLNGFHRVELAASAPAPGTIARASDIGYLLEPKAGQIWGLDESGVVILDESAQPPSDGNPAAPSRPAASPGARKLDAELQNSRIRLLYVTLVLLDTQLRAYQISHDGATPDFLQHGEWKRFSATSDKSFAIRNPLNNFSGLLVVPRPPRPTDPIRQPGVGFVFCASEGRFWPTGADGASVMDRDLRATHPDAFDTCAPGGESALAADNRARSQLLLLSAVRTAIRLYRMQHAGQLPDFNRYPDWQQLTMRTDASGRPTSSGQFGPYLSEPPRNLITGEHRVLVVRSIRDAQNAHADQPIGYALDLSAQRIYSADLSQPPGDIEANPAGTAQADP